MDQYIIVFLSMQLNLQWSVETNVELGLVLVNSMVACRTSVIFCGVFQASGGKHKASAERESRATEKITPVLQTTKLVFFLNQFEVNHTQSWLPRTRLPISITT